MKQQQQGNTPSSSKIKFEYSSEEEDEEIDSEVSEYNNNSSSSSDDDEVEAELENELANIPLGELQRAKADGSISVFNKQKAQVKPKRANKNRPMEVSSKKPVGVFREVIQAPKKVVRDPRFETLCGTLDVDRFKKKYDFLYQENLPAEKEELKKLLRSSKNPDDIEEMKKRIAFIDKLLKSDSAKRKEVQILSEHKKKEREAARQGKRPFYLKKSEIKKQRLVEKFHGLKAAGKLDTYMEKRRKRNAAKDHRYLPYRRPDNVE